MAQWLSGTVTNNHHWHANLFSLKVQTPAFNFTAGQFVRLALNTADGRLQRAYSLVNSPGSAEQEFLVSTVADGKLSPLLQQLKIGGVMVIPYGEGADQVMLRLTKVSEREIETEEFENFKFVPMLKGVAR